MRYLFAMLSCGRPAYVKQTLASYVEHLAVSPAAVYVYDDGGQTPPSAFEVWEGVPVTVESHPARLGRCAAHAKLWKHAAASDLDWAFTVEDDVVLLRPLDLRDLAAVIEAEPTLEQLALVRCPWGDEVEHGGFIAQYPWKYERRRSTVSVVRHDVGCSAGLEWIASTEDWTNSPALFPTSLPRELPWPAEPGCELLIGPRILAARPDAVSGYWGWGEPLCAHVGMERAAGSWGY